MSNSRESKEKDRVRTGSKIIIVLIFNPFNPSSGTTPTPSQLILYYFTTDTHLSTFILCPYLLVKPDLYLYT